MTGVQTCALPIYEAGRRNQQKKANTKLEKPMATGQTKDTKGKGSRVQGKHGCKSSTNSETGRSKRCFGDCQHTDLRDCICVRRGQLTTRQPHLTRALNLRIEEWKRHSRQEKQREPKSGKQRPKPGKCQGKSRNHQKKEGTPKRGGLTRKRGCKLFFYNEAVSRSQQMKAQD